MSKKEMSAAVVGVVLFTALVYFSALFFSSWLLMLVIGALHSYFPKVPALGYWPVFFITWFLFLIAGIFRSSKSD